MVELGLAPPPPVEAATVSLPGTNDFEAARSLNLDRWHKGLVSRNKSFIMIATKSTLHYGVCDKKVYSLTVAFTAWFSRKAWAVRIASQIHHLPVHGPNSVPQPPVQSPVMLAWQTFLRQCARSHPPICPCDPMP